MYNDIKLEITNGTGSLSNLYKVEMMDENGFITTVYEKTFNDAIEYAKYYFDNTEKRKKSYDSIESMIELDKKNGIKPTLD
jgi:hypothetical protein